MDTPEVTIYNYILFCPECIYIYLHTIQISETLLFCKVDRFFGPTSTWAVQMHLIMWTFACYRWLNQQLDIIIALHGTHSTSLWLSFLASIQQGRALECGFIVLNSMSTHWHAYRKYTGSLQKTDASIFQTYSSGFEGIHVSEVPIYYHLLYWSTDDSRCCFVHQGVCFWQVMKS